MIKETIDTINKKELNFWYPLIISFVGIGITWGVNTSRLNNLEERFNYFGTRYENRIIAVDTKLEKQDYVFVDIQVRLAEIQKDILFIKETLNK